MALSSGVIFDAGFQHEVSEINITSFKCLALITQEAVVSLLAAMVGFQRSPQPSRVRSRLQAGCDRSTTPSCFAALFTSASEWRRSGRVGSRPGLGIVLASSRVIGHTPGWYIRLYADRRPRLNTSASYLFSLTSGAAGPTTQSAPETVSASHVESGGYFKDLPRL